MMISYISAGNDLSHDLQESEKNRFSSGDSINNSSVNYGKLKHLRSAKINLSKTLYAYN